MVLFKVRKNIVRKKMLTKVTGRIKCCYCFAYINQTKHFFTKNLVTYNQFAGMVLEVHFL